MQFLELIEYNVSVTASLYASYYFELRTLCEKADAACGQSGHIFVGHSWPLRSLQTASEGLGLPC